MAVDSGMSYNLAQIRLLEAVSFRSFPATTTVYDGTWAVRMTAGHPAKRLNSVNPLDPNDLLDLENRIKKVERRFEGFGRPLVFRLTPLAPVSLTELFVEQGWESFEESIVMMLNLDKVDLQSVYDQVPLKDVGRWVDSYITLTKDRPEIKPGFVEVINATQPTTGLFLHAEAGSGHNASLVRCVCDRQLAGVFDLVTCDTMQRQGHAKNIMHTALLWAKRNGAKQVWLQVVAENAPANGLYSLLGFKEVYRYQYWKPPVKFGAV